MTTTADTPRTRSQHASTTTTPEGATTDKPKRRSAPRVPSGMKPVKFHLPEQEFNDLTQIAESDDRKPDDLARVLTRKHIRENKSSNSSSVSYGGADASA